GMSMLDKIWKPDTFFWNGHGSWLHTLTTPNRLVRLSAQGEVLYSSRLTVKAKCEMDLHRFPLDIQACRLVIGSFAYSANEMNFRWKTVGKNRGVHMDYKAIRDLPQFELRH
uniref:Neurotransmitter-gated ion-channel ligand-binding domain-containing protein n=1 Tax=Parascaris univalens TaxID=6257 RepID=A0A915AH37_PARUN